MRTLVVVCEDMTEAQHDAAKAQFIRPEVYTTRSAELALVSIFEAWRLRLTISGYGAIGFAVHDGCTWFGRKFTNPTQPKLEQLRNDHLIFGIDQLTLACHRDNRQPPPMSALLVDTDSVRPLELKRRPSLRRPSLHLTHA